MHVSRILKLVVITIETFIARKQTKDNMYEQLK